MKHWFLLLLLFINVYNTSVAQQKGLQQSVQKTLNQFDLLKIFIYGQYIPKFYKYDKDWYITITLDGQSQTLPYYFNKDNFSRVNYHTKMQFNIFSYKSTKITVRLEIHASFTISREIKYELTHPQRSNIGQNKLFLTILSRNDMKKESIVLPHNLDTQQGYLINFAHDDKYNDYIIEKIKTPLYDSSYWDQKDIQLNILPWIPFLSSCQGYGSNVILFDLLENNNKCNLVKPSETQVVDELMVRGLEGLGDMCNYEIMCQYDQDLDLDTTFTKWYEINKEQVLFYMTRQAYGFDDYQNFQKSTEQKKLQKLIDTNSELIVPIFIIPQGYQKDEDGKPYYPSEVELKLKYKQETTKMKYLVSGQLILKNYKSAKEYKNKMKSTTNKFNPLFRFKLSFDMMNYVEQLYSFQFSQYSYLLIFVGFTFLVYFFLYIFYKINQLISPINCAPTMRFIQTYKILFYPMIGGIFYGGSLYTLQIVLINLVYIGQLFDPMKYQIDSYTYDPVLQEQNNRGRLGLYIFTSAIVFLYYGSSLIIYSPSEEEEKIFQANFKNKLQQETIEEDQSNASFSDNDNDDLLDDSNSMERKRQTELIQQAKQKIQDQISTDINYNEIILFKRINYLFINLLVGLLLIIIFELSYIPDFKKRQHYYLFLFMLLETILISVCFGILQEQLLIVPIIISSEVLQFVTVMAADNFYEFVFYYMVRLIVQYSQRIYIAPILWNLSIKISKLEQWASKNNYLRVSQILKKIIKVKDKQKLNYYRHELRQNDEQQVEEKQFEPLINMSMNFTCRAFAIFIRPLIYFTLQLYDKEVQISIQYNFRDTVFYKYLTFSIVMLSQSINEVFIFNIIEILHDWKLYDYFSYCNFRYKLRNFQWLPSTYSLDKSLEINYRSLDNLMFSTQYYLCMSIISFGIIMISIGVSIMQKNSYVFFKDPGIFVIISFYFFLGLTVKVIIKFVTTNYIQIWQIKRNKQQNSLANINNYINTNGELNLESMIEAELIRKHFISYNKEWIINNLRYFVKQENFEENERFLLNLYEQLNIGDQIEKKKLRRDLLLKQKFEKQQQIQMEREKKLIKINLNQQMGIQDDNILKIKYQEAEFIKKILGQWLNKSKESLYLQSLVKHVRDKKKSENCQNCNIDVELKLIELKPLQQLMKQFRFKIVGRFFDKEEWVNFYEKNQQFKTLCIECHQKKNSKKQPVNISMQQKLFLLNWLMKTRSYMLLKKIDEKQMDQSQQIKQRINWVK